MRYSTRLSGLVAAVAAISFGATATPVHAAGDDSDSGAVFVQTNSPTGNAIASYRRGEDGSLTYVASFESGGLGAREQGAVADPLASQGSLALVARERVLLAVNAGSDTVSVFDVQGAHLRLVQTVNSGGPFPSGLAVRDDLVYVMDAGGAGYISGFRLAGGRLHAIQGSTRSLGLGNSSNPFFLSSPAQVGFTPDGGHLVVTTKGNGGVDVFSVGADGRVGTAPTANATGHVPFAFTFDTAGHLVLNYAETSSLQLFAIGGNGAITALGPRLTDGQAAACWVASARGFAYAGNAGSGDVSEFRIDGGAVSLVNPVAATGIPGAIDMAVAARKFLYSESEVTQTVHAYSIGSGGSLSPTQVVTVPDGASMEGIAVS